VNWRNRPIARAGLSRAGGHRRGTEQKRQDRDAARDAHTLVQPDHVAARNVTQFVRDNTLNLVGIIGGGDQARVDVNRLSLHGEGVDLAVVDQHDVDVFGAHPGGLDQGARHVAEQGLALGIAKDGLSRRGLEQRRKAQRDDHDQTDEVSPGASGGGIRRGARMGGC
jgi:hypothetical protein